MKSTLQKQWTVASVIMLGVMCLSLVNFTSVYAKQSTLACHPAVSRQMPQYLIGYGSTIDEGSRLKSMPKATKLMPVWVQGWRRGFYMRSPYQPGTTFLGVKRDAKAHFNAVLVPASMADIPRLDAREMGYCRRLIARGELVAMQGVIPAGQYWMYVPQKIELPNSVYPLVQSYVDLFIGGCMQVAKEWHLPHFAKTCVDTTKGWSTHWVNDRLYARRPFAEQPKAVQIDMLLRDRLPHAISGRHLES